MCIGISMVITRGRTEPYWLDGENSHEKIRTHYKIRDGIGYESLPVEFHPTGVLTNKADWSYHLDINTGLPEWYEEKETEYQHECRIVLEKIIDEIKKTKKYSGSLDLYRTSIASLGALQSVGGYLYLHNTPITSLGALQSVGGSLDLHNTPITSLGALQSVGGSLNLYDTPIASLGKLQSVGGYLDLHNTPITSLGKLQSVGGSLNLYDTPIASLGKLQSVGWSLDLRGTKINIEDAKKRFKNVIA